MNKVDETLLTEIVGSDYETADAINIRKNGEILKRSVSPYIDIVSKKDKSGIDIIVKDNVLWGKLDSTLDEINEALKLSCSYSFVYNDLKNGIDSEVGQTGSNLSGGQRQRICLARALIRKPKILILDDVTSALDRATEFEIINNLKTKLKDTTKIIISQKITSVKNADKIIVLDNGHISNIGNHEYLINHDPIYKDMYELQKKAGV